MRESVLRLLASLALVLQPVLGYALALSEVQLSSALDQPLDARVNVVSATSSELNNLKIAASTIPGLSQTEIPLTCELRHDRNGSYIQITSRESIREPILKVLLQVNWSGGSLTRDYSLILDPR